MGKDTLSVSLIVGVPAAMPVFIPVPGSVKIFITIVLRAVAGKTENKKGAQTDLN